MSRFLVAFLVCWLSAAVAVAHEAPSAGFGKLSTEAPPQTVQFGFLVGDWSCQTRGMRPDGSVQDGPVATWTGYYILDGWAIQDDYVSPRPDGKLFHGTNVRSFDPETGKWDNRWLAAGTQKWKYFEAEQVGDTMVMTGGKGVDGRSREFVDRNIFHEIGEDSWKWRKDRSFDAGETWIEGISFIHCTTKTAEPEAAEPEAAESEAAGMVP